MKKIIYHGSEKIIEQPIFGFGKTYNDYGPGFYCTEDPALAKEWSIDSHRSGYAKPYSFDYCNKKRANCVRLRAVKDRPYALF